MRNLLFVANFMVIFFMISCGGGGSSVGDVVEHPDVNIYYRGIMNEKHSYYVVVDHPLNLENSSSEWSSANIQVFQNLIRIKNSTEHVVQIFDTDNITDDVTVAVAYASRTNGVTSGAFEKTFTLNTNIESNLETLTGIVEPTFTLTKTSEDSTTKLLALKLVIEDDYDYQIKYTSGYNSGSQLSNASNEFELQANLADTEIFIEIEINVKGQFLQIYQGMNSID